MMYERGFNSRKYGFMTAIDGKQTRCYRDWKEMMRRAYDPKFHERYPTYADVTVCPAWHDFQNFAAWWWSQSRDWFGNESFALDKDLLIRGNKIYSPDTCCIIPRSINVFDIARDACRGKFPNGVYYNKNAGKFRAQININGKQKHLGLFETPEEAREVYILAKKAQAVSFIEKFPEMPLKLKRALLSYNPK